MNASFVPQPIRHCVQYLRYYGLGTALRNAVPYFRELIFRTERRAEHEEEFDAKFGTDTSSAAWPWDLPSLKTGGPDVHGYEPLGAGAIREILAALPLSSERFTFVDLGSGKGRVLLVASEFPFARIVGVELASELHAIAQSNVALYRPASQACRTFELQQGDAGEFIFPAGPLVLFMYSPFGRKTMARVIEQLEASLRRAPRAACVVYVNPQFDDQLAGAAFLRKLPTPAWYSLYRALP